MDALAERYGWSLAAINRLRLPDVDALAVAVKRNVEERETKT